MNIVYKHINEIIPYEKNPRKNDHGIDAVAMSIREFGFKVPVILDSKGEIIAGHTRIKAAKQLGIDQIPCIIADDLTDAQIKGFRIADNRVAEYSEWDFGLLGVELQELLDMDFDIGITGFDENTLNDEPMGPHNIDGLLTELEIKEAVKKPIWIVIRTEEENKPALEKALSELPRHIKVERSYG